MPTTLTSDTRPAKASEAAASTAAPAPPHDPSRLCQPGFAVRAKWFWYSVASCACWTGWALTARLGSSSIPAPTMEVVSTFGFVLVTLAVVLASARRPAERDLLGSGYALVSGILLGLGGVALYQAYRVGRNASVVTATSSLYPIVTVVCATVFLRERLTRLQFCGLVFAMVAIVTLSL